MIIGNKLKDIHFTQDYDVVIIGSGVGSLTLGAILSKQGQRVLILEKHYTAGGFTHSYTRKGYEWDVGLHYVGDVHKTQHPFRLLFDYITDSNLKWSYMGETFEEVYFPDRSYKYKATKDAQIEYLCSIFPDETKAIIRYFELLKEAQESIRNFCMKRVAPSILPVNLKAFNYYSSKSTLEILSRITSNQKLIGVLTAQYGDYGLPPSMSSFVVHATVAQHYIDGGNYPIGGSSRIASEVLKVINKAGGDICVKASVKKILISKNEAYAVELESGELIKAKRIVSNAGARNTYLKLIGAETLGDKFFQKIKQTRYSSGYFSLYLGFKKDAKSLHLPKANKWIYPSYDHDKNIKSYFENQNNPLPLTYISFPSAKDDTFTDRYAGRATIDILGVSSMKWFEKWKESTWPKRSRSNEDYVEYKKSLEDRYLDKLYEYMPNLKGQVDYFESSSPLTTRDFCQYEEGEVYGLELSPDRFTQEWLRPKTPIKNLFLTGQDVLINGVSGAMMAGLMTATAMEPLKTFYHLVPKGIFNKS